VDTYKRLLSNLYTFYVSIRIDELHTNIHAHIRTQMRENESARERILSPRALKPAREHIVELETGCKAMTMTTEMESRGDPFVPELKRKGKNK